MKNIFLFNKKSEINKDSGTKLVDQYIEIAKLVKEARIQKNLTIKELSYISKIPERIINSIEKTIQDRYVTYDFERLMENATLVSCSGFAKEMIKRM